jgi:hypothetical protein
MQNDKYKELLKRYLEYTWSAESKAVFLVRNFVTQINTKTKWIDVVDSNNWVHKSGLTGFNYLVIEIFDRKIKPIYPIKTADINDSVYRSICRAITWEVSHQDIENQREKGIRGPMYLLTISIYNKNRGKKKIVMKPFWNEEYGGFDHTGKVPTTEKKFVEDMEPDWDYRFTELKQINDEVVNRISRYFDKYIYDKIINERRIDIEWFFIDYEPPIKQLSLQMKKQKKKPKPHKPKQKSTSHYPALLRNN